MLLLVDGIWFSGRGQYVCDAEDRGQCWYSDDGDNWTYLDGQSVTGEAFERAAIRLLGGPRAGVIVR